MAGKFKGAVWRAGAACLPLFTGAGVASAQEPGSSSRPLELPPVVVSAPLQPALEEMAEGATLLEGPSLDRRRAATLGETLEFLPGMSASQFGPGASRPIIRGMGGPRVRVMQNGLDAFDASTVSPDHAVAVPMGGAERVEVLRGPATLLYGSSAIGGAVNVIDRRILTALPENGLSGRGSLSYASGAREKAGFAAIDSAVSDRFAIHADAATETAGDYAVNGFASDAARDAGIESRVDNSSQRGKNGAIGASVIGDAGYAGISLSRLNRYYGVPGDDPVHIDLRQNRLDAKMGLYDPLPFLEEAKAAFGYADYLHDEIEASGQPASRFDSEQWEARLEAVHHPLLGGLRGTFGLQSSYRDLTVTGEEAILPGTLTRGNAAFLVESYEIGPWQFMLGGRAEHARVAAESQGRDLGYTPLSVSGSAVYQLGAGYAAGLSLSRTERAPTAEELFSNGEHPATRSFELGNAALDKEQAWHTEASLRKSGGDWDGAVHVFRTLFSNYIYGNFTGNQVNGLNELAYAQTRAEFLGVELEGEWRFATLSGFALSLDGTMSLVRAKDKENATSLPLVPPVSLLAGLNAQSDPLDLRLEVIGVLDQDHPGVNESATGGYTLLNASVSWRPFDSNRGVALQLQGRNLTDAEGRNHTSMLKDVAPIRGREARLALAFKF